jgi:hypothetical protein
MFTTNRTNIKDLYRPSQALALSGDGQNVSFTNKIVSMGNAPPSQDPDLILNVKGNTKIDGKINTNEIVITSDYRLKSNIHSLNKDAIVDNLNPVIYNKNNNNKKEIGFIAHELQQHYPDLVNGTKDDEQIQTVNYNGLIGILVNEIQMLKKRVLILEKIK